jgi:hypothetical protein
VVTGLTGQNSGFVHMLHTGLTSGVDQSDRSGLSVAGALFSSGVLHAFIQRELHWFRGELFVVCRALVWWLALFA